MADEKDEIILYEHLKPKIFEDGDRRWRKVEDCTETTDKVKDRLSDDHTTAELLKADMKMFKKIGWLLVTLSATQLFASIFNNILR